MGVSPNCIGMHSRHLETVEPARHQLRSTETLDHQRSTQLTQDPGLNFMNALSGIEAQQKHPMKKTKAKERGRRRGCGTQNVHAHK
jgi:hypothetical protein